MFCIRWSSFSTTWLRFSARIRSVSKCRRAWEEERKRYAVLKQEAFGSIQAKSAEFE